MWRANKSDHADEEEQTCHEVPAKR